MARERLLISSPALPSQSDNRPAKRPTFPQFLQIKSHDPQRLQRDDGKNNGLGKHCLEVSSESSFLERGHAPEAKTNTKKRRHADDSFDPETVSHHESNRKRKRSLTPSVEVRSPSRDRPKETFERRARHKTKEDRYEPKSRTEKQGKERKSKPRTEKKGERRKASKKTGEDLMRNFESKYIGNDRLTASIWLPVRYWAVVDCCAASTVSETGIVQPGARFIT